MAVHANRAEHAPSPKGSGVLETLIFKEKSGQLGSGPMTDRLPPGGGVQPGMGRYPTALGAPLPRGLQTVAWAITDPSFLPHTPPG